MAQKSAPRKPNIAMAMLCLLILLPVIAAFSEFRAPVCLVCMILTTGISTVFGIVYLAGIKRVGTWDRRNVPVIVKQGFALTQGLLLLLNAVLWPVQAIAAPFPALERKSLFLLQTVGIAICLGLGAIPSLLEKKP